MNPLPAPIADSLHVLPPASLPALLALAALALVVLALLVLRHLLWRRARPAAAPPIPPPPVPDGVPAATIGERIAAIERQYTRSKAFRDGCHALASTVKQHLAQITGLEAETMTSAELAETFERGVRVGGPRKGARIGGPTLGRFMTRLTRRRFGRDEPRRRHFLDACGKAKELLG